jgi:hypothetical protein
VNRNKKLPVVTVAPRDEAARLADLPAEATVALQDVAAAIKDGLMAFCCSAGLAVVAQLMEAELTDKVGPKGRHDPERRAVRNGSAPGSVTLGSELKGTTGPLGLGNSDRVASSIGIAKGHRAQVPRIDHPPRRAHAGVRFLLPAEPLVSHQPPRTPLK